MIETRIEQRTRLQWQQQSSWPREGTAPVIALGTRPALVALTGDGTGLMQRPPEGYEINVEQYKGRTVVWVAGNDSRGVLFGEGLFTTST